MLLINTIWMALMSMFGAVVGENQKISVQQEGFEIHVTFTNYEELVIDGEEIFLRKGGSSDRLAQTRIKDGKAVLRGRVAEPSVAMLSTNSKHLIRGVKVLVENTRYETTVNAKDRSNILFTTTSPFHNVWREFFRSLRGIDSLTAEYVNLHSSFIAEGKQSQADSMLMLMEVNKKKKQWLYKELGYQHRDNLATVYIYTAIPDPDEEFFQIFDGFSDELKSSEWGKQAKRNLDLWYQSYSKDPSDNMTDDPIEEQTVKHPLVGQFLPGISGRSPEDEQWLIDHHYIAKQGARLTIIDFWASWCAPCRTLNIALYPFYFRHKDKGLEVYSFSLDQYQEQWLAAIKEDKIPWHNFSDLLGSNKSPVRSDFQIMALPTNVLVDSTGKIVGVNVFTEEEILAYLE